MKYRVIYRSNIKNIIKYFNSLQELNDYYGFTFTEKTIFPTLKENVQGKYTLFIDKNE